MASADLRAELECSICQNIYTDPVTLKCGHNFCRDCIGPIMDIQEGYGSYSCPECREEFQERPALHRNITPENFLSAQEQSRILCTYCIHTAVPAVKSCLMCEASLCDNHLRVHSKAPEHVLCDPTTSLESRKCSVHKKILEYYCTKDSACICVSCSLAGEHRGHQVETLEEASEKKKKKLRDVLQNLMTKREETEKRVQSLEERRRKVQGQADGETERVTALFRDLRRRLEDLEKRILSDISGQAERISIYVSDMIRELGIKKDELSRKIRHIEELCHMTDPLTVLGESDTGDLCDTEDGHDEGTHDDGGGLDVAGVSHTLHTGLCDIMSGVNVQKRPGTRVHPHSSTEDKAHTTAEPSTPCTQPTPTTEHPHCQAGGPNIGSVEQTWGVLGPRPQSTPTVQDSTLQAGASNVGPVQHTLGVSGVTDIFLDVRTAGNNLHISDDRRTATWRQKSQNHPDTPERFQDCPQVLSSQRFSSGRHYWEVDVGKSKSWIVGMCYPSIDRRGDEAEIGENQKSWGLERKPYNKYSVRHDSIEILLPGKMSSNRVRIFLDYEAGRISFYDLCDPIRLLHTFTTTFTEPLHAGVYVLRGCVTISQENQM